MNMPQTISDKVVYERLDAGLPVYGFCLGDDQYDDESKVYGPYEDIPYEYAQCIRKEAEDDSGEDIELVLVQAEKINAVDLIDVGDIIEVIKSQYDLDDLSVDEKAFAEFLSKGVFLDGTKSYTYVWLRLRTIRKNDTGKSHSDDVFRVR